MAVSAVPTMTVSAHGGCPAGRSHYIPVFAIALEYWPITRACPGRTISLGEVILWPYGSTIVVSVLTDERFGMENTVEQLELAGANDS